MRRQLQRASLLSAALALPSNSHAQWLEQQFNLQAGWNSVFLEVDPAPAEADLLFADLPVEVVWMRSPGRLIQGPPNCLNPDDPACTPPDSTGWSVWVPPAHPHRVVTNLRMIRGGAVYLVKAHASATWNVVGTPDGSVTQWRSGLNLVGLHVVEHPPSAPTFAAYLSGSSAHAAATVFSIQGDGAAVQIPNPAATQVLPGRGYWISSSRDTAYDGPVGVDHGSLRAIDFGQDLLEHSVELVNRTSSARTVTLTRMDSAPVPSSPEGLPALAGNVPVVALEFSDGVPLEQALQWHALGTHSWPVGAAGSPAATRSVRLSVDRAGLAPASLDLDGQGSQYQGLLLLTDGVGFRRWLGIRAQVLGDGASAAGGAAGTGTTPGLYFGHVTVDRVAWITAGAAVWTNADPNDPQLEDNPDKDTITLRPAPAAFVFPVIIHLSESGAYHLLTEVTLLFKPGDKKLGEPGQYVLATPACGTACDGLLAGSIQDGQPFARRFSSAAFVFDSDLPLSGSFAGMLEGQTTLATNHRLNPFHHRYHPDHDCNADGECFEIGRTFEFAFDSGPPPGQSPAGWGDALLGGSYAETITGLHKDPIRVSGRFDLRRVSNVAVLNVQN